MAPTEKLTELDVKGIKGNDLFALKFNTNNNNRIFSRC